MPTLRAGPFVATVSLVALGLAAAVLLARTPPAAEAAPCPSPVSSFSAGTITIQGDPSCAFNDEDFRVYCDGSVKFDYVVNGVQAISGNDTGVACGTPTRIHVIGNGGDDNIDLSSVTPGNGFTAIAQNQVEGGFQNDTVLGSAFADLISGGDGRDFLAGGPGADTVAGGAGNDLLALRDGTGDSADCGDGFDGAQADQASLDSVANCEITDRSPEPAKKKCRKKHGKKRHCKKRHAAT